MRSLDEMQLQAEDVIARATDRESKDVPTQLEVKLAGDLIKLIQIFRRVKSLIAFGFWDKWVELMKEIGIK